MRRFQTPKNNFLRPLFSDDIKVFMDMYAVDNLYDMLYYMPKLLAEIQCGSFRELLLMLGILIEKGWTFKDAAKSILESKSEMK